MNQLSEYDIRRNKVSTLRTLGINPFAQQRKKTHNISTLHGHCEAATADEAIHLRSIDDILVSPTKSISIAGRLMLKRVSGKLSF